MKKIDDHVFEALFRQAIIDEYNEEINSIPPKEELIKTITFSPEFELKTKRLFAREKRKVCYKKTLLYSKRVAAAFFNRRMRGWCLFFYNRRTWADC